jgi:programmed cell death 6-interacting protein
MLAVSNKLTDPIELSQCISQYCEAAFGRDSVVSLKSFMQTVDELRIEGVMGTNSFEAQRNGLRRYLGVLQLLEEKFPIGQPVNPHTQVPFPSPQFVWSDSFRPRLKAKGSTVGFERACVLFNYAANQSMLARDTDRSSPEGQKLALQLYQTSAGVFLLLRDQIVPKCVASGDTLGLDLSDGALSMCASLMLAQAQALFYEKAVKEKSSRGLLAKLANQAASFYASAGEMAISLKEYLDPSWAVHCKFQELLFLSAAHFQQSMSDKPNVLAKLTGFGSLVSRLRYAREIAGEAAKLGSKNAASIQPLRDAIQAELTPLEYDNANVYIEVIPDAQTGLSPIGLVPAVKASGASLAELVDMSYVIPFGATIDSLAPVEIKMKVGLLENETERIAMKVTSELNNQLRVKNNNYSILIPETESENGNATLQISDETWSKITRIQVLGGALALDGQLATLAGLTQNCDSLVAAVGRAIEEEERDDKSCRDRFGVKFNRVPSNQLNANFYTQLSNYRQKLQLAVDTNRKVRERIQSQDKAIVGVLNKSREELDAIWIEKRLASKRDAVNRATNPQVEQMKSECRAKLDAVESLIKAASSEAGQFTLKHARNPARLGEMMKSVDIDAYCRQVVSDCESEAKQMVDTIHAEYIKLSDELDKSYNQLVLLINDASPTGGISKYYNANWGQALDTCAGIILQGFSDVNEGINFFNKLNDYLGKLKTQVDDFCFARNEEKTGVMKNIQRELTDRKDDDNKPSHYSFGSPQVRLD